MVREFKKPEYEPYPSSASVPSVQPTGMHYFLSKEHLIQRLRSFIENVVVSKIELQNSINSKAIVTTGRDDVLDEVLSSEWDKGTEIPLALYEKIKYSESAKHQYLSSVVLDATRGVTGDFSLDTIDVFDYMLHEANNALEYALLETSLVAGKDIGAFEQLVASIETIYIDGVSMRKYARATDNMWSVTRQESDPVTRATQIQKSMHNALGKITSTVIQQKSTLSEIKNTSDLFYKERLGQLITGYDNDSDIFYKLVFERADLIADASNRLWKAVNAGNALQEGWSAKSSESGVKPQDVAYQGYVNPNPENMSYGLGLLDKIQPVSYPTMTDGEQVFIRKTAYTEEDVQSIVDMLNSLPENSTFIKAGIINVRSDYGFVENLLQRINEMPDGSTLISGGMIALTGKTLDEFQGEVEDGISAAYDSAQDVIDTLNASAGETTGLTILMPGIIGLAGSEGIRNAIVDAINNIDENSTLIGAGAVLVTGDQDDTLLEKLNDNDDLLSYFGIRNSTLIDGSKIMTSGIMADTILTGLSTVGPQTILTDKAVGEAPVEIDIGVSSFLREIRSVSSEVETYGQAVPIEWPEDGDYFKYKLEIASSYEEDDQPEWKYIRGGDGENWSQSERSEVTLANDDVTDVPTVLLLDGSSAQHIRFTFGGFFDKQGLIISGEPLSVTFQVYGALAYIDGGNISVKNLRAISSSTGELEIGTDGHIRAGKESYNSSLPGFWMGWEWDDEQEEDGDYKLSIGDGEATLKWDGTTLKIGRGIDLGGLIPTKMIDGQTVGFFSETEPESGMRYGDYWVDIDDNRYYAYREFILNKNPLAYWPLDDDNDSFQSNGGFIDLVEDRLVSCEDGFSRSNSSALPYGKSICTDGSATNHMVATDPPSPNTQMTISFWFRSGNSLPQGTIICSKVGASYGWSVRTADVAEGSGELYLKLQTSDDTDQPDLSTIVNVMDGRWHHIFFSIKAGTLASICCVDGVQQDSATLLIGSGFSDTAAQLRLLYSYTDDSNEIMPVSLLSTSLSIHSPTVTVTST